MDNQAPATPAPAAAPGAGPQVPPVTPAATSAPATPGDQGNTNQGTVTISLKEYRDLQRQDARARAFDKRGKLPTGTQMQPGDNDDPELVKRFNESEAGRLAAEKRAMQAEVREKVREILDKPEYQKIPVSTKALILKNPASLSDAETLEESIIDIEQFLGEQAAAVADAPNPTPAPTNPVNPAAPVTQPRPETPPTVNHGNPAPAPAAGLEDTSNLRGAARSQAMIRNKVREAQGVKAVI